MWYYLNSRVAIASFAAMLSCTKIIYSQGLYLPLFNLQRYIASGLSGTLENVTTASLPITLTFVLTDLIAQDAIKEIQEKG